MKGRRIIKLICLLCCLHTAVVAQDAKHALRYEIDAKRAGINELSREALLRSREFKRIDSTYYVGWMLEGIYLYNIAEDAKGYKDAIPALERALFLLDKDFKKSLKVRSDDFFVFYPAYRYQVDYSQTAYYLYNAYANTLQYNEAYDLLQTVKQYRFQKDFYIDPYNLLGWTIHKNRFYTSEKYNFLKDTIDSNWAFANRSLDSGYRNIYRNKPLNEALFGPGHEMNDIYAYYHYKAILHSYHFNYDSAKYYYDRLKPSPIFSYNNYATFKMINGDFADAYKNYELAEQKEMDDKRLKEYYYYKSILELYRMRPVQSEDILQTAIGKYGSTPGFGWYNIALSRALLYAGDLEMSIKKLDKAAHFQELHIGTTLGEAHYDLAVQTLKLSQIQQSIDRIVFENKVYWYKPKVLWTLLKLNIQHFFQQYICINLLSLNPERENVVYRIFSSENALSWDDVNTLIQTFKSQYFFDLFEKYLKEDQREKIKPYYTYFKALTLFQKGDLKDAQSILEKSLSEDWIEEVFNKLLYYRSTELLTKIYKQQEDERYLAGRVAMFQLDATLAMLSQMPIPLNIQIEGPDSLAKPLAKQLKKANIDWLEGKDIPQVHIVIKPNDSLTNVELSIDYGLDADVKGQVLTFEKNESAFSKRILYSIFNSSFSKDPNSTASL